MAVLKYKDPQGNWQTLDTGSGSVSSVEITELPYGSEPTARITAGTLYIGWPDGVPIDSVITGESDNPVTSAAIYQALQDTPGMAPVQSVNGQTGAVVLDAQDVGAYEKPATGIPASDLAAGVIPAVPVQDVQVNGASVVQDGVANVQIDVTQEEFDALSDDVAGLESTVADKAPVIINSASGAVASFSDGADGMPVKDLTVGIEPVQDLHGYDNPWPGGGGKNLLKNELVSGTQSGVTITVDEFGVITLNGTATANFTLSINSSIGLGAGEYIINGVTNGSGTTYKLEARYNGTWGHNVYNGDTTASVSGTFDSLVLAVYSGAVLSNVVIKPMIRLSSASDATYAPYSNICPITGWTGANISHSGADTTNPTVYPITFPTEAGTVYGGTLDVTTGTLTVDRAEVDLGTLTWYYSASGNPFFYAPIDNNIKKPYDWNAIPNWLCSRYKTVSGNSISAGVTGIGGNPANSQVRICDTAYTDTASFKTAMSGVQLVYELAEPTTYNLTALEVLETLKGVNNIWADTGAVNVEYCADTKTYVDDAVPVQDVKVNGTSILSNGVANVPVATDQIPGVAMYNSTYGVRISNGFAVIQYASNDNIKSGISDYRPIVPTKQDRSVFYGLAKASGDTTQSASSNPVGTYTDAAKVAIQKMLGIYQPPFELIYDETLAEEGQIDITVDPNGNPINLLDVFIIVTYPANAPTASVGYGRYEFMNVNGYSLVAETGKYTPSAYTCFKYVYLQRRANLSLVSFTNKSTDGDAGAWRIKGFGSGYYIDFGNIVRIRNKASDTEPAGTRIRVYAQKAY